ncbi:MULTISPECIES: I78 family peptidase inhibitor [Asticcacaulis]|uniref:I78 family peptidase inhibitor n=1 Tax=Asticcacaulis TaxID=76890 RepID=UPI001FDAC68D|nr:MULTISPECIES: I78 family peptidase inhibitor [Asticcacaulis]MBP2158130.1 hypothetical protein [Asticcacaulis solisilvae]MDR6799175.1 hypothetical protein [Asticcacaulis sp. BE141]
MILKKVLALGLIAAGLYGCASGPEEAPPPPARSTPPAVAVPSPTPVPPRPAPPPRAPEYKPLANDTCGAQPLQSLVGKPRTEIPVPLYPDRRRVVCSTCVVTQEFRADRQTIVFDTDTGIIKSVTCG